MKKISRNPITNVDYLIPDKLDDSHALNEFINNNLDILFTHVYTDFWNINSAKCISNECTTY